MCVQNDLTVCYVALSMSALNKTANLGDAIAYRAISNQPKPQHVTQPPTAEISYLPVAPPCPKADFVKNDDHPYC